VSRAPGGVGRVARDIPREDLLVKKTLMTLAAVAALSLTSCVGPYNAFNSVSSWNSRVSEEKWVNELLYFGLHIVPVYPLAAVGDALIFNSIEFWGGENPISKPEPFTSQSGEE
jgi:hypothetical protein